MCISVYKRLFCSAAFLREIGTELCRLRKIAEWYGTDTKAISKNFTQNKERHTEGKHYYCLTGDAKREFLNRYQIDDGLRITVFYLWTEKGALLHTESLCAALYGVFLCRAASFPVEQVKRLTRAYSV